VRTETKYFTLDYQVLYEKTYYQELPYSLSSSVANYFHCQSIIATAIHIHIVIAVAEFTMKREFTIFHLLCSLP
jgi:hypothetical protein